MRPLAAVLYFAIVSAVGLVHGPVRVFWLEPVVKTFIAANFGVLPLIIFWALMGAASRSSPLHSPRSRSGGGYGRGP